MDTWNADAIAEGATPSSSSSSSSSSASSASSPLNCDVMHLDLDSLDSVRAFAHALNARGEPVHCLINNAGVFDMSGAYHKTKDGHEQHYGRVVCICVVTPGCHSILLRGPGLCRLSSTAPCFACEITL